MFTKIMWKVFFGLVFISIIDHLNIIYKTWCGHGFMALNFEDKFWGSRISRWVAQKRYNCVSTHWRLCCKNKVPESFQNDCHELYDRGSGGRPHSTWTNILWKDIKMSRKSQEEIKYTKIWLLNCKNVLCVSWFSMCDKVIVQNMLETYMWWSDMFVSF